MTYDYAKLKQILPDTVKNIEAIEQEGDKLRLTQKSWKPEIGEKYGFVDDSGAWILCKWQNDAIDNHRHAIGNCYPYTDEGKELAIWEQVTRRKYERALWDAADWVIGDSYFFAYWDPRGRGIHVGVSLPVLHMLPMPRFATRKSAIEAHTRILGNDAERYLRGIL